MASPLQAVPVDNYAFQAGEGQMLPEFDSAVLGMKEGESKTFDLAFPADYQGKPTWPARRPSLK